jgi:hypothetical protein
MMNKIKKLMLLTAISAAVISLLMTTLLTANAADPTLFKPVTGPSGGKITYVNALPSGEWTSIMGSVISLILAITGSLAFAAFTYGGVLMVTAQGNDEQIRKGKNILFWSILALVIIAGSYGIVIGVSQLKFFQ